MRKGFAPIIVIVALAVVGLVAGGAYYIDRNYSKTSQSAAQQVTDQQLTETSPSPASTLKPDETANWKTYTNEKYGFIVKYPADKFTVEEKEHAIFVLKPIGEMSSFAGIFIDTGTPAVRNYSEGIRNLKKELVNPREEILQNGTKVSGTFGPPPKDSEMSLEDTQIVRAFLEHGSTYITISSTDESSFQYFDPILSTFKFSQ